MKLHVNLETNSYDIYMEKGILNRLDNYIDTSKKFMIISDEGVPKQYIDTVLQQCPKGYTHIVKQGEGSKSLGVYQEICEHMLKENFSRKDYIIALGGGVVGDLSGFVAATYMRGISFIQIPTTTLSQIDSSIGGKVAVNLDPIKNVLGCFYQPEMVMIDPNVLSTLTHRHYINGLIEALKEGLIYDASLFALFEEDSIDEHLEEIIYKALMVKKDVVEKDEREQNLRKILNFGHTIGHGIESVYGLSGLLHGECVALGMLYFIENEPLKQRVLSIYDKLGIKSDVEYDGDQVFEMMKNDKKASNGTISIVTVKELGKADIKTITLEELKHYLKGTTL